MFLFFCLKANSNTKSWKPRYGKTSTIDLAAKFCIICNPHQQV